MKKNDYAFINRRMKTHVEMFKQAARAAKKMSEFLQNKQESAKAALSPNLGAPQEQLQLPPKLSQD